MYAKEPDNPVTSRSIQYEALLDMARGGPEEPWITYEFGGGRKQYWSNLQDEDAGIYGKPVSVADGVTTHLPDPDLVSTNP
jgi:hypothetical protein